VEVILLERIPKVGNLGDKVNVKSGYGRNFLIPQKKALPATEVNLVRFEAQRAELEKQAQLIVDTAQKRASKLEGLTVTIAANASEEGKLFGSVSSYEIVKALAELGHEVVKAEVFIPEGTIRQIGQYPIVLQLHGEDVIANITVIVKSA
jgi:large subunit ribosomal protein L9